MDLIPDVVDLAKVHNLAQQHVGGEAAASYRMTMFNDWGDECAHACTIGYSRVSVSPKSNLR